MTRVNQDLFTMSYLKEGISFSTVSLNTVRHCIFLYVCCIYGISFIVHLGLGFFQEDMKSNAFLFHGCNSTFLEMSSTRMSRLNRARTANSVHSSIVWVVALRLSADTVERQRVRMNPAGWDESIRLG